MSNEAWNTLFKIVATLTCGAIVYKVIDEKYVLQAKNTPLGDFAFIPPQPYRQLPQDCQLKQLF